MRNGDKAYTKACEMMAVSACGAVWVLFLLISMLTKDVMQLVELNESQQKDTTPETKNLSLAGRSRRDLPCRYATSFRMG
jgi:hypothetical protein